MDNRSKRLSVLNEQARSWSESHIGLNISFGLKLDAYELWSWLIRTAPSPRDLLKNGWHPASQTLCLADTHWQCPTNFVRLQDPGSNDHCLILNFVLAMSVNVAPSLVGTKKTIPGSETHFHLIPRLTMLGYLLPATLYVFLFEVERLHSFCYPGDSGLYCNMYC
jgi:hypothetical protein